MTTDALNPQDALVALMIAVSAADEKIVERELVAIRAIVGRMPVFDGYDQDRIGQMSALVGELFGHEDGVDALIGLVEQALPDHLRETAYALACDLAAADGRIHQTEARMLEIVRQDLNIGRLVAAAIERGARARHQKLTPPPV